MDRKLINGKLKTRDEAVLDNMALVRKVANGFKLKAKKAGFEFKDMESIGAIGLMKAFDKFDPNMKNEFSTYAVVTIFGELQNTFRQGHEKGLRYPDHIRRKALHAKRMEIEHLPVEEMAKWLDVTIARAKLIKEFIFAPQSIRLDSVVSEDNDNLMHDLIGNTEDTTSVFVNDFLQYCTQKEQDVVRILMAGGTQKDVATYWGNVRSAAWPTVKKVRKKLATYMNDERIYLKRA
jgi:RNA polymerase sporulation-specific sigma factor